VKVNMSDITFETNLEKYARVVLEVGLNLQPGQRLLIVAPLETAPFVRLITDHAYRSGARLVGVLWQDDALERSRFLHAPETSFSQGWAWQDAAYNDVALANDAFLVIEAFDPNFLAGVNAERVAAERQARNARRKIFYERLLSDKFNWCVVGAAVKPWAESVFPSSKETALEQTWQAIFAALRLTEPNPVAAWRTHADALETKAKTLSARHFYAVSFRGPGTDLEIGLAENHRWLGGWSRTPEGLAYIANLPTEELYTAPDRLRVNGKVRGTRPALLGGTLVTNWDLEFVNGKVVKAQAERGEAALHAQLETDEGSRYLGEVALVTSESPVARSNLLYKHVLYDENAGSHFALGATIATTLEGARDDETTLALGGNISSSHEDMVMGSDAVDVDGLAKDGGRTPLLRAGQWQF
jgi:aminopeptidase